MRLFITLILFVGSILEIEAMRIDDQELVSVGIYKKAYRVRLVSPRGRNYVRKIANSNVHSSKFSREDNIRIDLHHLFSKAFIQAWKISVKQGQFYNEYMNFLLENKMSTYDINVLYQILNKYKPDDTRSEDQNSVIRNLYPILNKFTPDADYYRDITYVTNYIKDPKDVVMFYEIIAKNLESLGLEKTFFNISRERFAQIDQIRDASLDRKKDCLIKEYQNRFARENWLKSLYGDAVRYRVISPEEWNHVLNTQDQVVINPVKIVMNAAIKMVIQDFRLSEFLIKYGIHHSSIFQMIPVIKFFVNPNLKMIHYIDGLQSILRTVSDDLVQIGISDGAYYISKESVISSLQQN